MDKLKIFNEIVATVILILCVAGAIIAFLIYGHTTNRETVQHEYVYTISVDSTGIITKESQAQIDSVVESIKEHEQAIKSKYEYILEQREHSEDYLTIGGIFVTIVLSVFGFFGYKSFKSIEEEAVKNAEGAAKKKLDEEMGGEIDRVSRKLETKMLKRFDEDIKPRVKAEVDAVTDEKFSNDLSAKINYINNYSDEMVSLRNDVENLKNKLSDAQDAGLEKGDKAADDAQPDMAQDEIIDQINKRRGRKNGISKGEKGGES